MNSKTIFLFAPNKNGDEILTIKRRKRSPDNSLQFDRITEGSRPSTLPNLVNGSLYFKKDPFEGVDIAIGTKNNCFKSNIPTLTFFHVTNIRQAQEDTENDILNYVEMKILAQVDCIKDASESEIEQAKNKYPNRDFCYCTFPIFEGSKLLGVDKKICMINVMGDPGVFFFDNGFHDANKSKLLCSGQRL